MKTTVRLLVWFTCLVTLTLAKGASFIEGITEPPRCVSPCVMNGNLEFELTGNLGDRFELLEADTVDSATWTVRQTVTLTARTQKICEPSSKTTTQKFYRIRRVP